MKWQLAADCVMLRFQMHSSLHRLTWRVRCAVFTRLHLTTIPWRRTPTYQDWLTRARSDHDYHASNPTLSGRSLSASPCLLMTLWMMISPWTRCLCHRLTEHCRMLFQLLSVQSTNTSTAVKNYPMHFCKWFRLNHHHHHHHPRISSWRKS